LIKIYVLTANSRISDYFLYPLRKNGRNLHSMGYEIQIGSSLSKRKLSSDILCLCSKYFTKWWHEPERVFSFVENLRPYCSKLVWFDDSDSTGVTHFELMPWVDLYLKKQILKDKTLYTKSFYGDRVFTDYYHQMFGVCDETPYQSKPLDIDHSHKLQLSWNIGLGDYAGNHLPRWKRALKRLLPPSYPKAFVPVNQPRPVDLMFRGTTAYTRNTVSFHRKQLSKSLKGISGCTKAVKGFVSLKQYIQELKQAKLFVSPFGWGEISFKDFEAMMYGAAMIKPDVSHMETWPDCFIPGETYIPIRWDFSDLPETVYHLLSNREKRIRIASQGQAMYESMVSEKGMQTFCKWFVQQIEI
jgi:hypothetical protein